MAPARLAGRGANWNEPTGTIAGLARGTLDGGGLISAEGENMRDTQGMGCWRARREFCVFSALALAGWSLVPGCEKSGGGKGSAAAGSGQPQRSPALSPVGSPIVVVATTGMITDAAQVIAGDRAVVTGIMGEGVDPHLYKASPGDMRLFNGADVVFYSGLHLEGRLADVLVKLARNKPTFAVTETIDPSLLREPPEFHGQFDPHVWFDVSMWSKAAERIRDAYAEIDPAGAGVYRANSEKYLAQLSELHGWCKAELARIPRERRVLVTAHDAFGYFGRAYDIDVLAIQGISTDSEASLRDMNGLVDTLVRRKIAAVFVESSVPRKTIDALVEGCVSRGHNVRIGGQLFSDAMGKAGTPEGTYIGMVRHNVSTIVAALLDEGGVGKPVGAASQKGGT